MLDVTTLLYILMGFMIVGSLAAIETSDLLSSVICVGAVGFALSLIDLLLSAPEVALTLSVVEVLTLIVLVRVVRTRRDTYHATDRDTLALAFVVGGLGVMLVLSYFALKGLPPFGSPKMWMSTPYLEKGLAHNSIANYVTSIMLDFRVYDTLGACAVVFAGVTGAYAVLRKVGEEIMKTPGLSIIVRTVSRVAVGFILIFGCYVLMSGLDGPGGGLAFGVILALVFMLVLLAFGRGVATRFISRRAVAMAAGLSVLTFLAVGLLGYMGMPHGTDAKFSDGKFFLNFIQCGKPYEMLSGGTAGLLDLAVGLMVGAIIFGVLTSLSSFHRRQRHDPREP